MAYNNDQDPTITFDESPSQPEISERVQFLLETAAGEAVNGEAAKDEQAQAERVAVIRTSDRISYKRCRRRWGWQSHLRHNLTQIQRASPLWFGSGFHFALEDFHGIRRYPNIEDAWLAYVDATRRADERALPDDWEELKDLGVGMLKYYKLWLQGRDPLTTYVVNGVPQIEVNFTIPIPLDPEYVKSCGYDKVVYSGTIDRVAIDENGQLWVVEYKTAKVIQTLHFQVDAQIGAYMWALEHLYPGMPIAGVIYQQHRKDIPNLGRVLKNGHVSVAQNQKTTHRFYRAALIKAYGSVQKAPKANVDYLNNLAAMESPDADDFIRRDRVYRNKASASSEAQKILWEAAEMINPNLPLYPNPTRDCSAMCPFISACVSMDDGSDWEHELKLGFEPNNAIFDGWKKFLKDPTPVEPAFDFASV